jgi:hypothetical protein
MNPYRFFTPAFSLLLIVTLPIFGCQKNTTTLNDTISRRTETALRERLQHQAPANYKENIDLLGRSAALFMVVVPETVPDDVEERLGQRFRETIAARAFFEQITESHVQEALWQRDRDLNEMKSLFLEALTLVSVSNHDFSFRLGNALGVENLLVMQIDSWPTSDGSSGPWLRMKLRLVQADLGLIIWTGSAEIESPVFVGSEELYPIAQHLSDHLLELFFDRFKKKWHRKRYDQLKKA